MFFTRLVSCFEEQSTAFPMEHLKNLNSFSLNKKIPCWDQNNNHWAHEKWKLWRETDLGEGATADTAKEHERIWNLHEQAIYKCKRVKRKQW